MTVSTKPALRLRKIWQKDNASFCVEWIDGVVQEFTLSDLQRQCPCAGCVDESTGERVADPANVPDGLRAIRLTNVGRYGVRIFFSQGCSNGIYGFDFLRAVGRECES